MTDNSSFIYGLAAASIFVLGLGVTLAVAYWRDPLRAALGALIGILVVFVGELRLPQISGTAKLNIDFGTAFSLRSDSFSISTSVPFESEVLAVVSVAVLAALALIGCIAREVKKP